VRPGGTVTAAVWDNFGLPHIRLIAHIAAVLDPSVDRNRLSQPLTAANEMAQLWRELGFWQVEQTSLMIRMEYSCFGDYWTPFTRGEGPLGPLNSESVGQHAFGTDQPFADCLPIRSARWPAFFFPAWLGLPRDCASIILRPQEWRAGVGRKTEEHEPLGCSVGHPTDVSRLSCPSFLLTRADHRNWRIL
jgi:hypothetical protein